MEMGLGLKSHLRDQRSEGSILQSLDWYSRVLSATLPPLLGINTIKSQPPPSKPKGKEHTQIDKHIQGHAK